MNKDVLKEFNELKEKLMSLEEKIKEMGEDKDKEDIKEEKEEKKESKEDTIKEIVSSLDNIAEKLEKTANPELIKIAYDIDYISDMLEQGKEAKAIIHDEDERYMKDYFIGGVRKHDEDEEYMKKFDIDISTELRDKYEKGELSKEASELPYNII